MSFITATRQNIKASTSISYTSGQAASYDLAKVGFLARVSVRFKGVLTCTHASKTSFTKAAEAPWNLAKRLRLTVNSNTDIWNTSGYGAYLQNLVNKINSQIDQVISGSSVFVFGNTVSSGGTANNVAFNLDLNVSINDRDALGLFLLQTSQAIATVTIEQGAAGDLMTDTDITASLTGAWYISTEYFEVPNEGKDYPALNTVHQVLEDTNTIQSVGENRFVIPRGNTYLKIINAVKINGSYTDTGIEKLGIKVNVANEPYAMLADDMKALQLNHYGRPLPTGVYIWDFFYQGIPNLGFNNRDFVFSGNVSELAQFLQIASGTTLGSNNNTVKTIRDMLVEVQSNNG